MEAFDYLLKSAGVLALFYLVYIFFLKKETLFTFNRYFLLLGILTTVCFPFLEFTKTILLEAPTFQPSQVFASTAQTDPQTSVGASKNILSLSFETILGIIYVSVVIILTIRLLLQFFSLGLLLKKYPAIKANGYTLIEASENISPFSFFRYLVYNPKMHAKAEMDMILKHEKAHISEFHSVDVVLSNLLAIVQWFNPLAWSYKKRTEENLEFLADRNTARQLSSIKEYQLALVKATSNTVAPTLTNQFYKSFIKKRIIMLNKKKSNKNSALKAVLVVPLLAIFLWSFNVKEEIKYATPLAKNNSSETANQKEQAPKMIFTQKNNTTEEATPEKKAAAVNKAEPHAKTTVPKEKYRVKIDKNTTDTALKEIKEYVKTNYGISFNYSTTRNKNSEITAINISYSGNGTNGNYQISQDGAIDEFYFFIDDGGKTGFWSEAAEKRHKDRMEKRKATMEKRKIEMKERREEMQQHREEMQQHLAKRKIELQKRREKIIEAQKQQTKQMPAESLNPKMSPNARIESKKHKYGADAKPNPPSSTDAQDPLYFVDGKRISKSDLKLLPAEKIDNVTILKGEKALKKYGGKGVNGVVEITTKKE